MSSQYNTLVAELITDAPLNALGPGKPDASKRNLLNQLTAEAVVAPHLPRDNTTALACCAGLWLRYDFLNESHNLSQDLDTADGSYWHALMHRREPDSGNAKYWFRHLGEHPVYSELAPQAAKIAEAHPDVQAAAYLITTPPWDPFAFVDLCANAIDTSTPLETICREIQRREWDLLFDFCYRRAAAI